MRVAVENPCFAHHRAAIERTGLATVPVPVDASGLDPDGLPNDVAAVLVAPAHSYPSGGTLDADRRHALIAWAARTGAIIIEDDYDAEFRYDRQPIGALQGLAPEQVVHIGCASKTVTPALRLGWMAAPEALIADLEQEKLYDDMGSNLLDQLAFARFVDSGDFSRHLRRVRPIYRARRDATRREARWQRTCRKCDPRARPRGSTCTYCYRKGSTNSSSPLKPMTAACSSKTAPGIGLNQTRRRLPSSLAMAVSAKRQSVAGSRSSRTRGAPAFSGLHLACSSAGLARIQRGVN
jgi:hypothetical protein